MIFNWDLGGDVVASMTVSKNIGLDDIKTLEFGLEGAKASILKQAKLNAANALTSTDAVVNAPQT